MALGKAFRWLRWPMDGREEVPSAERRAYRTPVAPTTGFSLFLTPVLKNAIPVDHRKHQVLSSL